MASLIRIRFEPDGSPDQDTARDRPLDTIGPVPPPNPPDNERGQTLPAARGTAGVERST